MTCKKRPKELSPKDQLLWNEVKKTIVPLSQVEKNLATEFEAALASPQKSVTGNKSQSQQIPKKKIVNSKPVVLRPVRPEYTGFNSASVSKDMKSALSLDEKTWKKIGKGKVSIDRRLDLHGMTQMQAHSRLFLVLEEAHRLDQRVVLVITGKGSGVLRDAVPRWLREPSFNALVSGSRQAHIGHGGEGALYVRVKRKNR